MNLKKLAICGLIIGGSFVPFYTNAAEAKQACVFKVTSTVGEKKAIDAAPVADRAKTTGKNKKTVCSIVSGDVLRDLAVSSLVLNSSKLTISGTAEGDAKTVRVAVKDIEDSKTIFNKKIRVSNEKWKAKITKKLPPGSYNIEISGPLSQKSSRINNMPVSVSLISGVLDITRVPTSGSKSSSSANLVVGSVPLLFGGRVNAGNSVPVAYLQITNTGNETTVLKGFGVKQTGSISSRSVIGFTAVDDNGGSRSFVGEAEGQPLFRNGLAFVPIEATFEPGQMKLFTIKAILANDISQDLGKQLKIDVVSLRANAWIQGQFPIQGTIWTISI